MTIIEEKAMFQALCLECLTPVIEKYNLHWDSSYKPAHLRPGVEDKSFRVLLLNETTGLSFQTLSYGHEIGATLYRVLDGQPLASEGDAYGLSFFIILRNPSLEVDSRITVPDDLLKQSPGVDADDLIRTYKIEAYKRVFLGYAKGVEECASDVMRGDFSIFPKMEEVVRAEFHGGSGSRRVPPNV